MWELIWRESSSVFLGSLIECSVQSVSVVVFGFGAIFVSLSLYRYRRSSPVPVVFHHFAYLCFCLCGCIFHLCVKPLWIDERLCLWWNHVINSFFPEKLSPTDLLFCDWLCRLIKDVQLEAASECSKWIAASS